MSPARVSDAGPQGGGGGRGLITVLVIVGVALTMVLLTRARPAVQPFDPRSARPDGANGLVLLLEQFGATVTITSQVPDPLANERVLVLTDRLNNDQRRQLVAFVEAGGVVVDADPLSDLHGGANTDQGAVAVDPSTVGFTVGGGSAELESNVTQGTCNIPALAKLRGVLAPQGLLFPTPVQADRCFTGDNTAPGAPSFVITRRMGDGIIVGLGDNHPLTNAYLRYADNSGLAVALLAPRADARVRVLLGSAIKPVPSDVGTGDERLVDLVRPGVWMALAQLALAFLIFAAARAVRPAKFVREPTVTQIAGNELVVATGNLMQRAQHHERAGWLLRSEMYHQLCGQFALPADTSIETLAHTIWHQCGTNQETTLELLNRQTNSASDLVRLAAQLQELRQSTLSPPLAHLEHR